MPLRLVSSILIDRLFSFLTIEKCKNASVYKIHFATLLILLSIPYESYTQIDSGYVEIKNGVLFYRVFGEGEPVVFLNGGPGLASNGYEVYATELEEKRQVILFDQRGTGKSLETKNKSFNPVSYTHLTLPTKA